MLIPMMTGTLSANLEEVGVLASVLSGAVLVVGGAEAAALGGDLGSSFST